ncbi:MAG TPA: hypothetical protein VMH02_01595 [Verrucomicrobiae bacterium]|nr:hypothetical protein [Verrucomicrobiae bacterium]
MAWGGFAILRARRQLAAAAERLRTLPIFEHARRSEAALERTAQAVAELVPLGQRAAAALQRIDRGLKALGLPQAVLAGRLAVLSILSLVR